MKTKTYIITTGSYDSYRIVNAVTGPDSPALSTLYKQFKQLYDIPDTPQKPLTDAFALMQRIRDYGTAESKVYKDHEGKLIVEAFVVWPCAEHGFLIDKLNEMWVE